MCFIRFSQQTANVSLHNSRGLSHNSKPHSCGASYTDVRGLQSDIVTSWCRAAQINTNRSHNEFPQQGVITDHLKLLCERQESHNSLNHYERWCTPYDIIILDEHTKAMYDLRFSWQWKPLISSLMKSPWHDTCNHYESTIGSACREATVRYYVCPLWAVLNPDPTPMTIGWHSQFTPPPPPPGYN
jgi:hypothetical protein